MEGKADDEDEVGSPVVSEDYEVESGVDDVEAETVGEGWDDWEKEDDSSSEEERNTIGDVPLRWYQGMDHIGYDRSGRKIMRGKRRSPLEEMLDPQAWRRVYDETNDEELTLTDRELEIVAKLRTGTYAGDYKDGDGKEAIAWTTDQVEIHPLPQPTEPKRRFTPSKHEAAKVVKIVRAIRKGLIKKTERPEKYGELYQFDVWAEDDEETEKSKSDQTRDLMRIHAPKERLPGHAESYNPPPEYLPTEEEKREWEEADPDDRKMNFLPQKYSSMRKVPLYPNFIKERFERCLDLYIATRARKEKLRINPEDLIPKLPSPEELKPFPNGLSSTISVDSRPRSMSVHRNGQYLAVGFEDGFARVYEVPLLRMMMETKLCDEAIVHVEWNPNRLALVFAACGGHDAYVVNAASPRLGSEANSTESKTLMESNELDDGNEPSDSTEWIEDQADVIAIKHKRRTRFVTWHEKGDYFAVVARDTTGSSVVLHRLSKRRSQIPFRKSGSSVQVVRFHPARPFLFVATKQHVRVYNLQKQLLAKKLVPGIRWISSMSVHSSGDHLIVGSYDQKLCWFDLDLASTPYKIIRNHDEAIRAVTYHPRLPLFADASDDGTVLVFHGMVYSDLMQNALIVPLKRIDLKDGKVSKLTILDITWHPNLPWLFSASGDNKISLYTNVY